MNDDQSEQEILSPTEKDVAMLEKELNTRYCQIGKLVLENVCKEQKEVNALTDKIIELKKQLSIDKKEIECPVCIAMNSHNSIYCKNCGSILDETNFKEQKNEDR